MSESVRRRGKLRRRSPFPRGLIRRLHADGYQIQKFYWNLPTMEQIWAAIASGEQIWLDHSWLIKKKRQRSLKRRAQRARVEVSADKS